MREIIVKIPDTAYEGILNADKVNGNWGKDLLGILCNAIANGTPLPKGHGRKFEEIVVEYPPRNLCTYPEYRGKPYFSIKYEENWEHIVGFGTYKPEVLSRYLQEYFIAPTIMKADKAESEG